MKIIIYFFIISILIFSCADENGGISYKSKKTYYNNSVDENKNTDSDEFNDSYIFKEGYIKTNDNINLYYRLFLKENSDGLIVLEHSYDSSLEEWGILIDTFLDLNYNLILYDLRAHGKSQENNNDNKYTEMKNDLNLIIDFAESENHNKFKNILFIANGVSANISLYNSDKLCDINSYFVLLSPDLEIQEGIAISEFNNYCENSSYLYLYSKKSFENINKNLYIYNYNNIETFIDNTSNYEGINLLLNNSFFLFKTKNIINRK